MRPLSLILSHTYNMHKTVLLVSCWFCCHHSHPQQVAPHWLQNACSLLQQSPGYKKPINEKIFMGFGSQICRHCLVSSAKQNRFASDLDSLRVAWLGAFQPYNMLIFCIFLIKPAKKSWSNLTAT